MIKTPHLLLYVVAGQVRANGSYVCNECLEQIYENEAMGMRFEYFDYKTLKNTDFFLHLCQNCFKTKIKDKPLKNLINYIPLLMMKGRVIEKGVYGYDPRIENEYFSVFEEDNYDYFLKATQEVVEEFTNRAIEDNPPDE